MTEERMIAIGVEDSEQNRAIMEQFGGDAQIVRECDTCGEPVMFSAKNLDVYEKHRATFRHYFCIDSAHPSDECNAVVDGEMLSVEEGLMRIHLSDRRN